MPKHRQQNKAHQTNRVDTAMQSSFEVVFVPNYEDIQRKAYQIHEEKGGSDLENWLEAERTLKEEHHVER